MLKAQPDDADLLFLTNGVDFIAKWDGSDDQVTLLSGLGITARRIKVFQNVMIYGDIVQSGERLPTTIVNSDVSKPEDITNGLASQLVVHSGDDAIFDLEPIGDNLAIYCEDTVVLAQFVGDPLVFIFREALSTVGLIAPGLVANFGDFHEFAGNDSQYRFDGTQGIPVNTHLMRPVLANRDPVRDGLGFTHFDELNGDLLWVFPLTSDSGAGDATSTPETGYVEHYLEHVDTEDPTPFSKRDFPFTAAGFFEKTSARLWSTITETWDEITFRWDDPSGFAAFPFSLVGDATGKLFELNTSNNADGVAMNSFVRFGRFPLGDGRMRGLLTRVYPFAVQNDGATWPLEVKLGLTDHASGEVTVTSAFDFTLTLTEGGHFVSPFRRARFVEVQFGTPGPSQPWELEGYMADIKVGGKR